MFELIFGLGWTAFSVFIMGIIIATDGINIVALGFMTLFLIIGLFLAWIGIKKVIANIATATKGEETYGIVIEVSPSGSSVNGRDILNAHIVIVEASGITGRYVEEIGTDYNKYREGDYVIVKHYKNDINIIATADAVNVPQHIVSKLESEGYFGGQVSYIQTDYDDGYFMGVDGQYQNYNEGYQQGFNGGYQNYNGGYQNYNQGFNVDSYNQPDD